MDKHVRRNAPVRRREAVGVLLRAYVSVIRSFYDRRSSWIVLLACVVALAYGGGLVMFWFHVVYLEEGGPAIAPWLHWLLDSTAGVAAFIPMVAVVLPLAARRQAPLHPAPTPGAVSVRPMRTALASGPIFALFTAPAPILHDELVGRGTWLADEVTRLAGNGYEPTGEPQHVPLVVEMVQQVAVGVPTYVAFMWLPLVAVELGARRRQGRVLEARPA